ncbi:hypothetical protein EHM69_11105 [candidate division KSB1 bacterium]|nr:MAG: hypothetical protein EHM69_11105 [candidate division KSB1 bacterium]
MKIAALILAVVGLVFSVCAQPTPTINFNLVQVNHYHGQNDSTKQVATPGQRVVIDLQNPLSRQQFLSNANPQIDLAPVSVQVFSPEMFFDGLSIPWETKVVLRSAASGDSFLVSSSKIGCPGTEVKPSVAVAFAMGRGWSDPPIRFGPLNEKTVCPLGHGYQLEVSAKGDHAPVVRLREPSADLYGKR